MFILPYGNIFYRLQAWRQSYLLFFSVSTVPLASGRYVETIFSPRWLVVIVIFLLYLFLWVLQPSAAIIITIIYVCMFDASYALHLILKWLGKSCLYCFIRICLLLFFWMLTAAAAIIILLTTAVWCILLVLATGSTKWLYYCWFVMYI